MLSKMQNSSVDGRQNVILKLGQQHAEFLMTVFLDCMLLSLVEVKPNIACLFTEFWLDMFWLLCFPLFTFIPSSITKEASHVGLYVSHTCNIHHWYCCNLRTCGGD